MRQGALKLEVFETVQQDQQAILLDPFQAEQMREAAFEQGYAAGWQDALEQLRNEDALRQIAAQEAVQAIGFSYSEAHQALAGSFLELLQAILDRVMPEAARLSVQLFLGAELDALFVKHTRPAVQIFCAPGALVALKQVVAASSPTEIELVAEPSFSEAQVSLRIGDQERVINLDDLLDRMRAIVAQDQNWQTTQETAYGRA